MKNAAVLFVSRVWLLTRKKTARVKRFDCNPMGGGGSMYKEVLGTSAFILCIDHCHQLIIHYLSFII